MDAITRSTGSGGSVAARSSRPDVRSVTRDSVRLSAARATARAPAELLPPCSVRTRPLTLVVTREAIERDPCSPNRSTRWMILSPEAPIDE